MVVTLVAISLLGGGLFYFLFRWMRDEVRNRKIRRLKKNVSIGPHGASTFSGRAPSRNIRP
jgi:hypothetical protein